MQYAVVLFLAEGRIKVFGPYGEKMAERIARIAGDIHDVERTEVHKLETI